MANNYEAINGYIVVDNIDQEIVVKGLSIPGTESALIRPQKALVKICQADLKGISEGGIIIYDTCRAVPFPMEGKIMTIIRISEVILLCPPEPS